MDKAVCTHPIHTKQHGFQKRKSTESALSNTVNYIESFVFKKQFALGIFLDISSAFDSICPVHIRNALLEWYYDYLVHRDMNFELHGETYRRSNGTGFPQGGSLLGEILAHRLR